MSNDPERARIDISGLPEDQPGHPDWRDVRKASEAGGFMDRTPRRASRRQLTGRDKQFNAKASADTIRRFNAICDEQQWVAGLALERLVVLAEAALRKGGIMEAIEALDRE